VQARALSGAARAQAVAHAQDLVRSTTQLRLDDGSLVSVDDSALAEAIGARGADIDGAIRDLAALEELARGPAVDLRTADARLQALVGAQRAQDAEVSVVDLVIRFIQRWVQEGLGPAADPRIRVVAEYGIGLALVVLVLAIVGRDLRERFRREVISADLGSTHRADPAVQLRLAEEALRAGDPRAAIHALYLYAIRALAAREVLRYDPSFTDRELLATARAIPHADALRDLVTLHELIWYGLRDAHTEDAARARRLAVEAAA
jgi:hypothetical protein